MKRLQPDRKKTSITENASGSISSGGSNSNPLDCLAEAALAIGSVDRKPISSSASNSHASDSPSSPPRDISIIPRETSCPKTDNGDSLSPVSISSGEIAQQRHRPRREFTFNKRKSSLKVNTNSSSNMYHSNSITTQCRDDEQVAFAVSKRGMTERRADKPYSYWHMCQPPPGFPFITLTKSSTKPALVSPSIQSRETSRIRADSISTFKRQASISKSTNSPPTAGYAVSKRTRSNDC